MYENLEKNQNLKEMNVDRTKWTYTDEKTGKRYKLYILG
jgi:hypothetical protein